jgi:hypothetical protein
MDRRNEGRRPRRYWLAKVVKWVQRASVQIWFGSGLILASHWWPDSGEREWMRDAGTIVFGIAFARWTRHQGERRRRTPTLRMTQEEVQQAMRNGE